MMRFFTGYGRKQNIRFMVLAAGTLVVLAALVILLISGPGRGTLKDGDYACDIGYEGLRVKRTIQALDLGETTGMGGAYYDEEVAGAVKNFQENHGLPATGKVDLRTWKALGLTEEEWNLCGTYQSPAQVADHADAKERIEAMIARAYDYLGDPYVIGASGPPGRQYGLDCSGLVMQGLYAAGIALADINPVTHAHPGHEYESRNLWLSDHFTVVEYEDRVRGDLIFYGNRDDVVIHIAIYLGDDEVIESWPDEVQVSPLIDGRHDNVVGVKRVF